MISQFFMEILEFFPESDNRYRISVCTYDTKEIPKLKCYRQLQKMRLAKNGSIQPQF